MKNTISLFAPQNRAQLTYLWLSKRLSDPVARLLFRYVPPLSFRLCLPNLPRPHIQKTSKDTQTQNGRIDLLYRPLSLRFRWPSPSRRRVLIALTLTDVIFPRTASKKVCSSHRRRDFSSSTWPHQTGSQPRFSTGSSAGGSISTSGVHRFDIRDELKMLSAARWIERFIASAYDKKSTNKYVVEDVLFESDLATIQ